MSSRVTFDDFPTTPYSGPSLSLGTILNTKFNSLKTACNSSVAFKLDWNPATSYLANDIARDGGSFWIALTDNLNSRPSSTNASWAQWQAMTPTLTAAQVGLGNVTNDAQLKAASNLSDLASRSTARTNLGLSSRTSLYIFEHFLSSVQGTVFSSTGRYQGNGTDIGTANPYSNPSVDDSRGLCCLSIGNTPSGDFAGIWTDTAFYSGQGLLFAEARVSLSQKSSASDPFVARFGFGLNQLQSTPATSLGWFEYDLTISPNWLCCTSASTTKTVVDSGVPVVASPDGGTTSTYKRLRVEISPTGTSVVFKIEDTIVATITTNLPSPNQYGRCNLALALVSKGGTAGRGLSCDYIEIRWGSL